jgi:para-nitrobenzyl esterase
MHRNLIALTVVAQLVVGLAQAGPLDSLVKTRSGYVRGVTLPGSGVHAFKGIPYASPPLGELRWRAPEPVKPWSGVRDAGKFASTCIQKIPSKPGTPAKPPGSGESEDCLYLNVWTSAKTAHDKHAVMVWIHGGGFNFGSTQIPTFDGARLARKGVVLVSIEYRLNVFGFLALPDLTQEAPYHASGNYGILDQIAALKWIHENIAAFGGDPDNVTLFGQSAGSVSVNVLQASPLAHGLFVRGIAESSSQMDSSAGLRGRRRLAQAEREGVEFARSVGAASLPDLRKLPAEALVRASPMQWVVEDDGYVLPGMVYDIFAQGRQNPAQLLVGATAEDAKGWHMNWIKPESPAEQAEYAALWGTGPDAGDRSDTDMFLWQMWSWVDLDSRTSDPKHKSYFYLFSQFPPEGAIIGSSGRTYPNGPVHASELIYVFDNLQTRDIHWTAGDQQVAASMSNYWVNFAKTGNPNGPGLPDWPSYSPSDTEIMNFDNGAHAMAMPHQDALQFIDGYVAKRR